MSKRKIINIVGKKYILTFIKKLLKYETENEKGEAETGYAYGECNSVLKTIKVCETLGEEEKFDTFMHELFHALDDELMLNLTHDQIRILSTSLADTLMRNKLIISNL